MTIAIFAVDVKTKHRFDILGIAGEYSELQDHHFYNVGIVIFLGFAVEIQ